MTELLELLQEELVAILGSMLTVTLIMLKTPKQSRKEKLQRLKEKAHENSTKKEKALHKAYEKEAKIDEEIKNEKQ